MEKTRTAVVAELVKAAKLMFNRSPLSDAELKHPAESALDGSGVVFPSIPRRVEHRPLADEPSGDNLADRAYWGEL